MSEGVSMCEFLSNAQREFDSACVAFSQRHNMTALASELGIQANVLRNMLNPEQPRLLTPPVLVTLTRLTGDYSLWNTLSRGLNFSIKMMQMRV